MSFLEKIFAGKKKNAPKKAQKQHFEPARSNIDSARDGKETPLFLAAYNNDLTQVKELLKQGANPNVPSFVNLPESKLFDPDVLPLAGSLIFQEKLKKQQNPTLYHRMELGITNLHYPASMGYAEVVHELLEAGANPNMRIFRGLFPLYASAEEGHLDIVKDLIEHGADINQTTPNNSTALNNAAEEGHLDVVKYLLSQGADPSIKTVKGHGPRDGAIHYGHYEVAGEIARFVASKENRHNEETESLPSKEVGDCYSDSIADLLLCLTFLSNRESLLTSLASKSKLMTSSVANAIKESALHLTSVMQTNGSPIPSSLERSSDFKLREENLTRKMMDIEETSPELLLAFPLHYAAKCAIETKSFAPQITYHHVMEAIVLILSIYEGWGLEAAKASLSSSFPDEPALTERFIEQIVEDFIVSSDTKENMASDNKDCIAAPAPSSLFSVCEEGDFDKALSLLKAGADPTIKTVNGRGPEDGARHYGHYKVAEAIANHKTAATPTSPTEAETFPLSTQ